MKFRLHGLLAVVVLASFGSVALADTIDECASGSSTTFGDTSTLTLTTYTGTTPPAGCTLGNTTFSNFEFYGASITGTITFSATINLDVTTNTLEIDTTGLTGTQDVHLTFQGTTGISTITLTAGVGDVVSEGICNTGWNISAGTSNCGSNLLNTIVLQASNGGSVTSPVTAATTDFFYKDISGGSEVDQTITPEPVTLGLVGGGLLLIGLGRRFRRR